MRILLGCEESQAVTKEFRALGHEAYSCDLKPCTGGHPEWHIQEDLFKVIAQDSWDLGVLFPPCTHLAVSGAKHFDIKRKDGRQAAAIKFFMDCVNAPIPKIAIENPVGIMSSEYRPPDQIIQPYHFGDPFTKTTCLWLKNLPKLKATHYDAPLFGMSVDKGEFYEFETAEGKTKRMPLWYAQAKGFGGKATKGQTHDVTRSKTFHGIARAMASTWSQKKATVSGDLI